MWICFRVRELHDWVCGSDAERDTQGLWPILPSALENQMWDVAKTSFTFVFVFARIGSMVSRLLISRRCWCKGYGVMSLKRVHHLSVHTLAYI